MDLTEDGSGRPARLPPLTALRAFDAAARHMSFAKAAEELAVTPAALSYQIKQLEQHLDQPLFRRMNRAVELTQAGRALRPGIGEGFAAFRRAVREMERLSASEGLTITAGPAFTAKFLAPRFFKFIEAHPDIELRFAASLRVMDFAREDVDAAIRFGRGADEGLFSESLTPERITPVCTPEIAAGLTRPEDLAAETLIHDESMTILARAPDWRDWLSAAGVEGVDATRGPRFSNADHVLDAAIEGTGVALGRLTLAEREVRAGRLVAPFPLAIDTGAHFRFVCPKGRERSPDLAAFRRWLADEMATLDDTFKDMTVVRVDGGSAV